MADDPDKVNLGYSLSSTMQRIRSESTAWGGKLPLAQELKIALEDLAPILSKAGVSWEMHQGLRPLITLRAAQKPALDPFRGTEAHSIRMMSSSLANPTTQFLSHTLEHAVLIARQRLTGELTRLYRHLAQADDDPGDVPRAAAAKPEAGLLPGRQATPANSSVAEQPPHSARSIEVSVDADGEASGKRVQEAGIEAAAAGAGSSGAADSTSREVASVPGRQAIPASPSGEQQPAHGAPSTKVSAQDAGAASEKVEQELAKVAAAAQAPASVNHEPCVPTQLRDWRRQGLAANRIFKELKQTSGLLEQIEQWQRLPHNSRLDVEYRVILRFLQHIRVFRVDGVEVEARIPDPERLGFSAFDRWLEPGVVDELATIDPRILRVVQNAFRFLSNWVRPRLDRP